VTLSPVSADASPLLDTARLTAPGVTVGFVVVPQGMAYALLAKLPAEYGLYTSFVGFLLYWAFATSKDITIGVGLHGIVLLRTLTR